MYQWFRLSIGVTSFFVNDFETVDSNVTRHLEDVMTAADQWEGLVLHFLGLDHIGHVEGPTSPLMGPKLEQMDRVLSALLTRLKVRENNIFKTMWSSLLDPFFSFLIGYQFAYGGLQNRENNQEFKCRV